MFILLFSLATRTIWLYSFELYAPLSTHLLPLFRRTILPCRRVLTSTTPRGEDSCDPVNKRMSLKLRIASHRLLTHSSIVQVRGDTNQGWESSYSTSLPRRQAGSARDSEWGVSIFHIPIWNI